MSDVAIEIIKYICTFLGGGAVMGITNLFNIKNKVKRSEIDNMVVIINTLTERLNNNTQKIVSMENRQTILERAVNCSFRCDLPNEAQKCPVIDYLEKNNEVK